MPVFIFVARNKRGRVVKGQLEAADEKLALAQLKRRNLSVQKLKKKPKELSESIPFLKPKVTKKDVVIFTRQFSTMITSGLPLLQGLGILADQCENPTFKGVLKDVAKSVEGGSSLSEAMQKYPNIFDDLYTNLVAAGEMGGVLDQTLQRLAAHMEKAEKLKARVKGALVYPIVVIGVAILVIAVIMVFVIPVFEKMFGEMGASLSTDWLSDGKEDGSIRLSALLAEPASRAALALELWLDRRGLRPPPGHRIAEFLRQLACAAPDRAPSLRGQGWRLRRFRERLFLLREPVPRLPPELDLPWDGEHPLALPDGSRRELRGDGPGRLKLELRVRARRGGVVDLVERDVRHPPNPVLRRLVHPLLRAGDVAYQSDPGALQFRQRHPARAAGVNLIAEVPGGGGGSHENRGPKKGGTNRHGGHLHRSILLDGQ
ncbi:MAG: type II secretion system F family protein [candidate division WOR-3 bacterium]